MPKYESSSDSDDEPTGLGKHGRLFGRQRPMHDVLGGGKVADVLLWRNNRVSAALLVGVTVIWFLFEVVEYNFLTLLCHISITTMLVTFIWYRTAEYMNWHPPNIPELLLRHEATLNDVASTFHRRFNQLMSNFLYIARESDVTGFFLTIISLYILSVIGSCFSFLNFLFIGLLCLLTLPYLYDRYENEADAFVGKLSRRAKKSYKKFDSNVLNKIPRGPVKDKKAL
ncbi:hypothetical protein SLE2022_345650 [Rubroshorea leprosula]